MANKTLLDAVNDLFRRAKIIAGDADVLTSLVDEARQADIDVAVQVINEGIDELYSVVDGELPAGTAEGTITLVSGTRSYALATNFVRLHFPLIDKTNIRYLFNYEGGYLDLLELDPDESNTGTPMWSVIKPTDGTLYIYPTPGASEDGAIYTYQYDKDLELVAFTDTVPFNNFVFRAMLPAWYEIWKRERRSDFDQALFKASIGRAARRLLKVAASDDYCPR
jgi:hypothetical protein